METRPYSTLVHLKTEADLEAYVREFVLEERERCARLAEIFPVQGKTPEHVEHAVSEFRAFAAAIRKGEA